MELTDLYFHKLTNHFDLQSFDCDDISINEFVHVDALNFQTEKMANTYLFVNNQNLIVAFFSICNDCLNDKGYENSTWNKLHRSIRLPNSKRIKQYPSVKIARLGIDKQFQGKGLSHQLLDFIKIWTIEESKPACRLLILDAYNQDKQLNLYLKNDFLFLHDKDLNDKHRLMFLLFQNVNKIHVFYFMQQYLNR